MPKIIEKLHLLICIFAAIVVTAAFLIIRRGDPLVQSVPWVSGTIVVFYFVGYAVRGFIINRIFPEWLEEEKKEETDETEDETDDTMAISDDSPAEAEELNGLDDLLGE